MENVFIMDHPLIQHKISMLRNKNTGTNEFRDIISINIPELKLEVKVSDEEMAARKAKWQPREPRVTTGYLARYAAMVTSGNRGAILEVPKAK